MVALRLKHQIELVCCARIQRALKVGGKGVVLFHSPETGQWHTTDALDIDHKTPWKEHLTKLDTKTMADAHMGYNDISNLRMLPSVFNRGRDSAENLLQKHGL